LQNKGFGVFQKALIIKRKEGKIEKFKYFLISVKIFALKIIKRKI